MHSPKNNTLSNNNFWGDKQNHDYKYVPMMRDEFKYLTDHLKKLSNKEQVKRFKYYAKKRINFYHRLLQLKKARSILSEYALSLIKKIAKKLDSTVTKVIKLFQKNDTHIKKYLQRSQVSPNYDNNNKGDRLPNSHEIFTIDESPLKKRTLIHLKRYLEQIPPTNIEELKAFKNLFDNRAKADMFENKNQNVQHIRNTLAFGINKNYSHTENIDALNELLKKNAIKEANRHLKIVAAARLKPNLVFTARSIAAKKKYEEARQRLERAYLEKQLKQTAEEENAETERILTQRRDDAALRLQSMGRMRSAKHTTNKIRSRQQKKRKKIEKRLRKKANFENRVTRSMERRREAARLGHENQLKRAQEEEEKVRKILSEGGSTKNTNPEVLKKVMAEEVTKALAGSSRRSPSVKQQTMHPPSSATASIIFVRPNFNGRMVKTPQFNANIKTNNKRQIVVRPEEETWVNTMRKIRNDAYYMFVPFSVRK
jgi:hypothetical protein